MAGNYQPAVRGKPAYLLSLVVIQNLHVGKYQRAAMKIRQRARRHDLKFQMLLQEEDQHALIRLQKLFCKIIPSGGREIDPDRIYRTARPVEGLFVLLYPTENFAPGGFIVRSGHHVPWRIPEVR